MIKNKTFIKITIYLRRRVYMIIIGFLIVVSMLLFQNNNINNLLQGQFEVVKTIGKGAAIEQRLVDGYIKLKFDNDSLRTVIFVYGRRHLQDQQELNGLRLYVQKKATRSMYTQPEEEYEVVRNKNGDIVLQVDTIPIKKTKKNK